MALVKVSSFYEIGVVKIGDLELESNKILKNVHIAYERTGPIGAPALLVCHALTGNQFAVGTRNNPGWWSELIGPGKMIDTNQVQVITTNVIGGCNGSTGPLNANPDTNKEYRTEFPFVTVRDIVHAQYLALKKLGIHHLHAVLGGSLGGMQVLEWGIMYPDFMSYLVPMAVTPFLSDYAIAFNTMGRIAIQQDTNWNNGDYNLNNPPTNGLSLARMVGMVTYRSGDLFNDRFKRKQKDTWGEAHNEITFDVESYLVYQGNKLSRRFDANSYLYLLKAMDSFDIRRNRGDLKSVLLQIKVPIIAIGFKGDLLYPPKEMGNFINHYKALGKTGWFYQVETMYGHDGFLVEFNKFGDIVREHLFNENDIKP